MCGVAGIINTTKSTHLGKAEIHAMNNTLRHRGPDGEGIWISKCNTIHFAHNRLSIIDLTDSANQPMHSVDEKYVLTFNGEIYNYLELKKECEKLGSKFKTHSDSEVIIESYRHWGAACFSRFKGMWAILFYDTIHQQVIISRDPFGIKPLYYSFFNGCFYVVSETKALTGIAGYFKEEDLVTSQLFLEHAYLEREDWTFYKNIKRFPHAHYAIIHLDKHQTQLSFIRYWQPSSVINYNLTFNQAAEKLKMLFHESIQLHLRSDVPVGACLSGGIDSSGIVSIGTSLLEHQRFTTFTSQYLSHAEIDETKWAQTVIDHTKANAYFVQPTLAVFQENLDDLITAQDEPFGSMSIFSQYCVFKKISETSIKVVLDGQGADEMLAGYLGFVPLYFDELLKKRRYMTLLKELIAFKDMDLQYNAKSKIVSAIKARLKRKNQFGRSAPVEISHCEDELQVRLNQLSSNFDCFEDRLGDLLLNSNIPQLLRYEDRNSMRFSIESRVPFLNTELVDFILTLPASYRIRNGYTKAVLREAFKGLIPEGVRVRRDKLGFPAPELQWLKEGYGVNATTTGGVEWRSFIYNRWRTVLDK